MYFKTLVDWRFQKYSPIKCSIKNNTIKWEKSKDFSSYAIYYSENKNSDGAKLILNNIYKK